jgi:hypothetical protein
MLRGLCVILLLATQGCGAYRTFALPVEAFSAARTFPALEHVAEEMGLTCARFDTAVHVQLGDSAYAYFTLQLDEYSLVIQIDESTVIESEREARWQAARAQACEIWNRAMAENSPHAENLRIQPDSSSTPPP